MIIRTAEEKDLEYLIQMLSDDQLGAQRENYILPLPASYRSAFKNISEDKNQELKVLVSAEDEVIGMFQLSFIQYLTYQGGIRAQIEGVRVSSSHRGKGLGKLMFEWAIDRAKEKGAHLIQLTSDKQRPEAIHFYEQLGFVTSHEGLKLKL